MRGLKILLVVLVVLALASFSQAATIFETKLSDLGQPNFTFEAANKKECFETVFSPSIDLNQEVFQIISVQANFLPSASKKSFVEVFLNQEKVGSLNSQDFKNNAGRFNVSQGKILEENSLEICGKTSFETTKIEILNDSTIGHYLKPDFEKKGSFQLIVSPKEPRLLEEFKVTAVLKNFGSESSPVILKYRKSSLEKETPETELVKGETKVERIVPSCSKYNERQCIEPGAVEFEYYLKSRVIGPITLLPSIAEFENPFGETVVIESNRPTIRVSEPEIKIKPFLQIQKEQFLAGETANLKIIITNEGQNALFNLLLKIKTNGLEMLKGNSKETIELIRAKETISREFTLSSIEAGQFRVGCTIDYLDYNAVQSACDEITIEFRNPTVDITLIGAAVLAVISIAIYAYIHLKK